MKRKILVKLKEWKEKTGKKPIIIRGARQVGKTWALKEFGKTCFPHWHYFNFEKNERLSNIFQRDLSPKRIISELEIHADAGIDLRHDLVIFDEIQQCPRAITSLKYFDEEIPGLALCAAGSFIGIYMSDMSFPVGKISFMDMYPMDFEEFLDSAGKTRLHDSLKAYSPGKGLPPGAHDQLWDLWKRYLITGGLPAAVNTYCQNADSLYQAVKSAREVQRNLIDAYLADIAKHSGKTSAMHIERLLRSVPAQLARAQDGSTSKFRFKDAVPGIRGYDRLSTPIQWLEKAGLILRAFIVDTSSLPLSGFQKDNAFKLYLFDTGLLGALSGLAPEAILNYGFGSYKGYFAENFVAQELRAAGFGLHCWQGRTSEVEFLLETRSGIIPCEVKSGSATRSRSLNVYEERYNPSRSVIFSSRNIDSAGMRVYAPVYAAGIAGRLMD